MAVDEKRTTWARLLCQRENILSFVVVMLLHSTDAGAFIR